MDAQFQEDSECPLQKQMLKHTSARLSLLMLWNHYTKFVNLHFEFDGTFSDTSGGNITVNILIITELFCGQDNKCYDGNRLKFI